MHEQKNTWLHVGLCVLLLTYTTGLLAAAAWALSLSCEGFACTSVGIVWLIWAMAAVFGLGCAALLQAVTQYLPRVRRLARLALQTTLVLMGVALLRWLTIA